MILISHRGNLDGVNEELENSPFYISEALQKQYEVEIDLRVVDGQFYLGHDKPQYNVEKDFLYQDNLFVHAKNKEAVEWLIDTDLHYFWHNTDDYAITSWGFICVLPGKEVVKKSIIMKPEEYHYSIKDFEKCFGICSDYIFRYRKALKL